MKGKIKTLIRLDSLLNGGGGADTVTYIHLMRHYFNYCSHSLDMPLTLCLCLQVRVCVCLLWGAAPTGVFHFRKCFCQPRPDLKSPISAVIDGHGRLHRGQSHDSGRVNHAWVGCETNSVIVESWFEVEEFAFSIRFLASALCTVMRWASVKKIKNKHNLLQFWEIRLGPRCRETLQAAGIQELKASFIKQKLNDPIKPKKVRKPKMSQRDKKHKAATQELKQSANQWKHTRNKKKNDSKQRGQTEKH